MITESASESVTEARQSLATLFFRTPRLAALALLIIFASGLSSLVTIGRQEDPSITNLFATIKTVFPGADPARVEALVTEPLERGLREVAEIETIASRSATGISILNVELNQTLTDQKIESVWSEIRDVLADVRMPAGAQAPGFDNDQVGAFAAISVLRAKQGEATPAVLNRYAQALADSMRAVSGTKLVEVFGEPREEVRVTVDSVVLASLGISVDQLSQTIAQADAKVQAGRVRGGSSDFLIEVQGEIDSLARLGRIPVSVASDGSVTRLVDIATITKTEQNPLATLAMVDGQRAVMVGARVSDGLQVDAWTKRLRMALAEFETRLPQSLEHQQIFDQSQYTTERLQSVAGNMAIGVTLVIVVLLLTLGWRAAAIVATVLPLVSLATVATLNFMGLSIQQMSVTGLIVALGLLVDAAIVMTDDVGHQLSQGRAPMQAVRQAVGRLAAPLLASTITTALAFMPMVLLPGPPGDFVGSIAISVIVMLFWSLAIALTLTPAFAAWFLPRSSPTDRRSALNHGIGGGWIGRRFERSLQWAMRNPINAVAYALVLPVIGFASFTTLTAQFFPGVDRDQFHIEVELPPGSALSRTNALVRKMDKSIRYTDGIEQVSWVTGRSAPAFYYNMQGGRDAAPGFANALIKTASADATARLVPLLQQRLSDDYPSARILVRDLVQGPPVNAPVELRLYGRNLEQLRVHGNAIRRLMTSVPAITVARTSLDGGAPKLSFKVDEDAARIAGLDLSSIARQLEAGLEGARGGSLVEATESLPVRVRVNNADRADLSFIGNFNLVPRGAGQPGGAHYPGVPLSALADATLVPAQSLINRRDGERVNTVQGFIKYGLLPEEALRQVVRAIEDSNYQLPSDVRLELGGDSDARNETINNLLAPLGLIVTLSIATIVMTFNSFRLAGISLLVAVLSAGLSVLALAVFRYPFGITAVIGVIGSIGVSINAAIIILSALKSDAGAVAGNVGSMVAVVMRSSRHIVSTTITTFGGFLPLILDGGGFWPPFAMSVAGGVLLSTVVSFYFTPPMFALLYARRPGASSAIDRALVAS